jgi:flavin-binding protein dodecin
MGGKTMAVFRKIELTGTSPNSIEEAIQNAIARSGETIRHLRWFEVVETRGTIENGKVGEWQVTIKIGFHVEEKHE